MSLDELNDDVVDAYSDLGDEISISLDQETKNELAMLIAALDPEDSEELLRRGVHMLFQASVETGTMDFHLRNSYDVTYDEYLSGMTYDEMAGPGMGFSSSSGDDERRYQF